MDLSNFIFLIKSILFKINVNNPHIKIKQVNSSEICARIINFSLTATKHY